MAEEAPATSYLDNTPLFSLASSSRVGSQESIPYFNAHSQFHPLLGQPIFSSNVNLLDWPPGVNVTSGASMNNVSHSTLSWCSFGQSSEEVITPELKRQLPEPDNEFMELKPKIEIDIIETEEIVPELTSELIIKDDNNEDVKTEFVDTVKEILDNSMSNTTVCDHPAVSFISPKPTTLNKTRTSDIHFQTSNTAPSFQSADKMLHLKSPLSQNAEILSSSLNSASGCVPPNVQSSKQTEIQKEGSALPYSPLADVSVLPKLTLNRTGELKRTPNIDGTCSSKTAATKINKVPSGQSHFKPQRQDVLEPSMRTQGAVNMYLQGSKRNFSGPPSSEANIQSAKKKLNSSPLCNQVSNTENGFNKFHSIQQTYSPRVPSSTKAESRAAGPQSNQDSLSSKMSHLISPLSQNAGISSSSLNSASGCVPPNVQSSKQTEIQKEGSALPYSPLANVSVLPKLTLNRTGEVKRTPNINGTCSSKTAATKINKVPSGQSHIKLQHQDVLEPSMRTQGAVNMYLQGSKRNFSGPPSSEANIQSAKKKLHSSPFQVPNSKNKFNSIQQTFSPCVPASTKSSPVSPSVGWSQPPNKVNSQAESKVISVRVNEVGFQNKNVSNSTVSKPSVITQISVLGVATNLPIPERNSKTTTSIQQKVPHVSVQTTSEIKRSPTNLPKSNAKVIEGQKSSTTSAEALLQPDSLDIATMVVDRETLPPNIQSCISSNSTNITTSSNSASTSITTKNIISSKSPPQNKINILKRKTMPSDLNSSQNIQTQKPSFSYKTHSEKHHQIMWKNTTRCYYNRKKFATTIIEGSVPSSVVSTPKEILDRALTIQEKPAKSFPSRQRAAAVAPQDQLTRLCRVCAKSSPLVADIFSSQESQQLLPSIIWQYLELKVERGDRLPQQICTDCRSLLLGFHCLKLSRRQAENRLQGLLKRAEQLDTQPQLSKSDDVTIQPAPLIPWSSGKSAEGAPAAVSVDEPTPGVKPSQEMHSGAGLNALATPGGSDSVLEYLDCQRPEPPYECSIDSCLYIVGQYNTVSGNAIRSLQRHYFDAHKLAICEFCFETFINEKVRNVHVNERHMIPCIVCGEKFLGFKRLDTHCRVVHFVYAPAPSVQLKNRYFCKCCDFATPSKVAIQKHYVSKHKKYFCFICSELFDSYGQHYEHFEEIHRAHCNLCKTNFFNYRTALAHISQFHKKKGLDIIQFSTPESQVYKCKYCHRGLSSNHNVKRHYYWFHKKYSCEHCLTPFNSLEMEEKHFNETHTKQCAVCRETFSNQQLLASHIEKNHPICKSYFCEFCGDLCKDRNILREHRKAIHGGAFEGLNLCEVCGKKCFSKYHLKLHQTKVHHCSTDTIRSTTCKICGKNFKNIPGLNLHLTIIHKKKIRDKNFKCTICNEYFASMCSLNSHVLRHSKYKCELCNMQFTFKLHLEEHVTDIHSIPTVSKCLICNQVFLSQVAFSTHLLGHAPDDISCTNPLSTKVPAMKCQLCGELFICKESLKKHMSCKHIRGRKIVNNSTQKPIGRKPYLLRVD